MRRELLCALSLLAAGAGCATVVTRTADLNTCPRGIRVYPPKVYLFVDEAEKKSQLVYAPDVRRAYDVKPFTFLAKQEFRVDVEDGQLKQLIANQDTTALLAVVRQAATVGAQAAGVPVSAQTFNGTFGLATGIYELQDDGAFHRVTTR